MAQRTSIEWCDVSWNPVHGCSKVSPGCAKCYAETLSLRYGHTTRPWTPAHAADNVMLKPHKLREPLSRAKPWDKPCLVFVNSMSDLFHERVPYEYIGECFRVMECATRHTFQILTKRPERMAEVMADLYACGLGFGEPLRNVWLGVSIENRRFVGRADVLRETPAAVRFISAEPLLGPLVPDRLEPPAGWPSAEQVAAVAPNDPLPVFMPGGDGVPRWDDGYAGPGLDLTDVDWLIVGGESGAGHRRLDVEWMRDLRDVAAAAGTAFFVKQMGGARPGTALEDLPPDLRIREMPAVA